MLSPIYVWVSQVVASVQISCSIVCLFNYAVIGAQLMKCRIGNGIMFMNVELRSTSVLRKWLGACSFKHCPSVSWRETIESPVKISSLLPIFEPQTSPKLLRIHNHHTATFSFGALITNSYKNSLIVFAMFLCPSAFNNSRRLYGF
jgi:hypothetical protein